MAENNPGNNRISVDWDGTCVENKYPEQGDWLPGAANALRGFLAAGREVIIFTARIAPFEVDEVTPRTFAQVEVEYDYIRRLLDEEGLQAVTIWEHPWKPAALVYIDDKALRYYNWDQATAGYDALFSPTVGERII